MGRRQFVRPLRVSISPAAVREVASPSWQSGVNVWNGDNYARELAGVLKIRDKGGAVRAGVVHYNDDSDVIRLLEALDELGPAAS